MREPKLPDSILRFANVSLGLKKGKKLVLHGVDFEVRPGELLLLEMDGEGCMELFGDAVQGMTTPLSGEILVGGRRWEVMRQTEVDSLRSRIGRVFVEDCWFHGMDLEDNILLAGRHHGRFADTELFHRADRLAQIFGLARVPAMFPEQASPVILIQAALIRAFLSDPFLLVLEKPIRNEVNLLCSLLKVINDFRHRGAAILWMENDRDILNDSSLEPTRVVDIREFRKEEYGAAV